MLVKSRKEFNEPMDAVVSGAMLSIGFATFENFAYVYIYEFNMDPLTVAMFKAFTAVPLHICCGIIMGYLIALGYHKPTAFFYSRAVSVPAFLHAIYNSIDEVAPAFMFMLFIIGLTILSHKRVRKAQIKMI